jgi:chromosome segregation ATPase
VELSSKCETTQKEKEQLETTYSETVEQFESKVKDLEKELEAIKNQLDAKEKLHNTYQEKIQSLLDSKEDLNDKLEEAEKREQELTEITEQFKNNVGKKDMIYAKMLKMKDKKMHKMTNQVEKLVNSEKSRVQTIEYFKKRIKALEKNNVE